MSAHAQPGFTAAEILITIFIGSLLLIGGYQAYSLVNSNTKDVRERAIVSNYGYDALRYVEAQYVESQCEARSERNLPSDVIPSNPSDGINITSARYSVTRPYGTSSDISKVTTKLTYGNPSKEVVHAIYAKEL